MAFPILHTPRLHNPSSLDSSACILAHVKKGEFRHALALYQRTEADPLAVVDANAFVALLKACSKLFNVAKGEEIHRKVEELGFLGRDVRLGNAVINMYMKCGCADKAHQSFDAMPFRNVVSWNTIIAGYAGNGHAEQALACFRSMQGDGIFPDAVTVICMLTACAMAGSMAEGQEIHAEIARKGCSWMGMDLGSALVSMYARCGCSAKAQEAFDRLRDRDAVTWNSLIAGYVNSVEKGQEWRALECLSEMRRGGISPDAITLSYSLKACGSIGCASMGEEIHGEIVKKGYLEQQQDTFLHCGVVYMYAKCGCLGAAQEAFKSFRCADIASWNALITGYVEQKQEEEAMHRFELLIMEGTTSSKTCPDVVTYRGVMKACGGLKDARKARQMHMEVTRKGWEESAGIESMLVDVYAKCGLLVEAQELLCKLRNGSSAMAWNALMLGYVEAGCGKDALDCFLCMQRSAFPGDALSFVCILKACVVDMGDATVVGYGIHADITRRGFLDCGELLLVGSALVDLYAKRGLLLEAESVLGMLPIRDVVCWTALIDGYAETDGLAAKALQCLKAMKLDGVPPNAITYASVLKACGAMGDVDKAREMHSEVAELGLLDMDHWPAGGGSSIASSLIEMYGSCGARTEAEQVFYDSAKKDQDTASWTAFIAVCSKCGDNNNVSEHMEAMRRVPWAAAYGCSLKACHGAASARAMHAEMVKAGMVEMEPHLATALLHAYCRCRCLPEAEHVFFDGLEEEERDAGTWNTLIAAYVNHGRADEAFRCLRAMEHAGVCFTTATYAHALQADGCDDGGQVMHLHCRLVKHGLECEAPIATALTDVYAKLGLWEEASVAVVGDMERMARDAATATTLLWCLKRSARVGWVHACREAHVTIAKLGLHDGMLVANSLLDAYAKCGLLQEAESTFDALAVRDVVSWTTLITAYSQLARPQDVLGAFIAMLADCIQPNSVTFTSILNSTCHGGLVDEAEIWLLAIRNHYRLVPSVEHFASLVDLFSRADLVQLAVLTIGNMPFHPCIVVWRIVLASCQRSGHVDFAMHAFRHSMELDKNDPASYVYMLNVCTISAK